jgi:hypothetical protein
MIRPMLVLALLMGAAASARADSAPVQTTDASALSGLGTVMDAENELDSVRAFGDEDTDWEDVAVPGTGLTLEDMNLGIGALNGRTHTLGTDAGLDNAPHPTILDMVTPKIQTRSRSF